MQDNILGVRPEWAKDDDVVWRMIIFHNGESHAGDHFVGTGKHFTEEMKKEDARAVVWDKADSMAVAFRTNTNRILGINIA